MFTYDALTDTQRLVRMPSEPTYCSALVSQARGCGPDRCVELNLGLAPIAVGGRQEVTRERMTGSVSVLTP